MAAAPSAAPAGGAAPRFASLPLAAPIVGVPSWTVLDASTSSDVMHAFLVATDADTELVEARLGAWKSKWEAMDAHPTRTPPLEGALRGLLRVAVWQDPTGGEGAGAGAEAEEGDAPPTPHAVAAPDTANIFTLRAFIRSMCLYTAVSTADPPLLVESLEHAQCAARLVFYITTRPGNFPVGGPVALEIPAPQAADPIFSVLAMAWAATRACLADTAYGAVLGVHGPDDVDAALGLAAKAAAFTEPYRPPEVAEWPVAAYAQRAEHLRHAAGVADAAAVLLFRGPAAFRVDGVLAPLEAPFFCHARFWGVLQHWLAAERGFLATLQFTDVVRAVRGDSALVAQAWTRIGTQLRYTYDRVRDACTGWDTFVRGHIKATPPLAPLGGVDRVLSSPQDSPAVEGTDMSYEAMMAVALAVDHVERDPVLALLAPPLDLAAPRVHPGVRKRDVAAAQAGGQLNLAQRVTLLVDEQQAPMAVQEVLWDRARTMRDAALLAFLRAPGMSVMGGAQHAVEFPAFVAGVIGQLSNAETTVRKTVLAAARDVMLTPDGAAANCARPEAVRDYMTAILKTDKPPPAPFLATLEDTALSVASLCPAPFPRTWTFVRVDPHASVSLDVLKREAARAAE